LYQYVFLGICGTKIFSFFPLETREILYNNEELFYNNLYTEINLINIKSDWNNPGINDIDLLYDIDLKKNDNFCIGPNIHNMIGMIQ